MSCFWPSDQVDVTYPRPGDVFTAGGGGIGADATGDLPIGDTSSIPAGNAIFIGGPNVIFGPQSDVGDPEPWDDGFVPQEPILDEVFADVDAQDNPNPELDLKLRGSVPANG